MESGKIAWCSCIGEKAREEVRLRDAMSEKDTATDKILTGEGVGEFLGYLLWRLMRAHAAVCPAEVEEGLCSRARKFLRYETFLCY